MPFVHAVAADIVFIAATNHTMPLSQFEEGRLTGGILKDDWKTVDTAKQAALQPIMTP